MSKPRLKFLRQMLYGIQITKSVILNKIAAEIDENIKQVKIEMRLCHHLAFKDLWKHIHEAYPPRTSVRAAIAFRASLVVSFFPLEGVAFRGCEGGAGGLEFHQ